MSVWRYTRDCSIIAVLVRVRVYVCVVLMKMMLVLSLDNAAICSARCPPSTQLPPMLTAQSRGISSHHSTDPTTDYHQASEPGQPQPPASSTRFLSPSPLPKLAPPTPDRSRCHEDETAVPPHFHLFPISNTNLQHAYRAASPPSAICYTISPGAWPRTDRASISGVGDSPSAMAAMTLSEQAHPHSNRLIYPRG